MLEGLGASKDDEDDCTVVKEIDRESGGDEPERLG